MIGIGDRNRDREDALTILHREESALPRKMNPSHGLREANRGVVQLVTMPASRLSCVATLWKHATRNFQARPCRPLAIGRQSQAARDIQHTPSLQDVRRDVAAEVRALC
jgi:hypothetical protein